jgi:hypothetical protein
MDFLRYMSKRGMAHGVRALRRANGSHEVDFYLAAMV